MVSTEAIAVIVRFWEGRGQYTSIIGIIEPTVRVVVLAIVACGHSILVVVEMVGALRVTGAVQSKIDPGVLDILEVVDVTPAAQVTYAPDHPMFAGGSLGECNPGA